MSHETRTPEQSTWDEFERVLRTDRFASIHDLARSRALADLTGGSAPLDQHVTSAEAAPSGPLPTRR